MICVKKTIKYAHLLFNYDVDGSVTRNAVTQGNKNVLLLKIYWPPENSKYRNDLELLRKLFENVERFSKLVDETIIYGD